MSFSFVKNSANNQTIEETQLVMVYELGKIFECLFDKRELSGYREFAMTELADFISMSRMLCEQVSWDYNSMLATKIYTFGYTREQLLAKMQVCVGKVIRGLHYKKRFDDYRGDSPDLCMQSLVDQTRRLCGLLDCDFWEVLELGEKRYVERMQDLQRNGIKEQLKTEYQRD